MFAGRSAQLRLPGSQGHGSSWCAPFCASQRNRKPSWRREAPTSAAAVTVLDRTSESAAPSDQVEKTASTLPANWSPNELDDEQISRELKARRQRSNSLAQTSKSAEAGLSQPGTEQKRSKSGRPSRSRQNTRTRSHRGASRQGHTQVDKAPAERSSEPLTQAQEHEVCRAIQVSALVLLAPVNSGVSLLLLERCLQLPVSLHLEAVWELSLMSLLHGKGSPLGSSHFAFHAGFRLV